MGLLRPFAAATHPQLSLARRAALHVAAGHVELAPDRHAVVTRARRDQLSPEHDLSLVVHVNKDAALGRVSSSEKKKCGRSRRPSSQECPPSMFESRPGAVCARHPWEDPM